MIEVRKIPLNSGETLEVEIHTGFYDELRKRFMLAEDQEITDDHVRMFIFGSVNNAINKVEKK